MAKTTLKQVFNAIERQILVGKTYVAVAKGLLAADWRVLVTAPTFFGLTLDGSQELAQMAVARIYDRTTGPVTIPRMLEQANLEIDSFKADRDTVNAAINDAKSKLVDLEPVLAAIATRRNEWLAHLDSRTVRDPRSLDQKASLTMPDLAVAFEISENIVVTLRGLFDGIVGPIRFSGDDDYKVVLRYIAIAQEAEKKDFAAEYEKQTGHPPSNEPLEPPRD